MRTALDSLDLRSTFFWWGLWTLVAALFAVHFRLHYDAAWPTAFRWGLVDWYVWGGLSLLVWWLCRRFPLESEEWLRPLAVHTVIMILMAATHVALVILVDRLLQPDPATFLNHFQSLFTKKLTLNFLTYSALVGAFHASIYQGRGSRLQKVLPEQEHSLRCEHLLVQTREKEIFLPVSEITHVTTAGNYVEVHSRKNSWLIRRTLKQLHAQLDRRFLRISRFVLVNLDHVSEIRRGFNGNYEVVLRGGDSHRLTRRYRSRLQEQLGRRF